MVGPSRGATSVTASTSAPLGAVLLMLAGGVLVLVAAAVISRRALATAWLMVGVAATMCLFATWWGTPSGSAVHTVLLVASALAGIATAVEARRHWTMLRRELGALRAWVRDRSGGPAGQDS